jgi:hypothetical protein
MITNRIAFPTLVLLATLLANAAVADDCTVGNTDPATGVQTDALAGAEKFGLVYRPIFTCPPVVSGFQPIRVHFAMEFGPEDVPASFSVRAHLGYNHLWFSGGDESYELPCENTVQIDIDEPGVHDIAVPLEPNMFCCGHLVNLYYPEIPERANVYYVVVEFPEPFPAGMTPSAPINEGIDDLSCETWAIDQGDGWVDGESLGWAGWPLIWADADYCENPTPAGLQGWSDIKALYR